MQPNYGPGHLLVARARSPKEIAAANNYQTNTIKAIVGNQLFNAPKVQDKVQYRGYPVELPHAPQLVEADIHHLLEHGRPMPEQIIRDWPNIAPPVKYQSVLGRIRKYYDIRLIMNNNSIPIH